MAQAGIESVLLIRKIMGLQHFNSHPAIGFPVAGESVSRLEKQAIVDIPASIVGDICPGLDQTVENHETTRLQHLVGLLQSCFPFMDVVEGSLAKDRRF